jgi:thiamine biosynthesis lipoprotein
MTQLPTGDEIHARDAESPTTEQRMRPVMGTFGVIEARGARPVVHSAIEAAFTALAHVEQCMHPTRAGSGLARLNESTDTLIKIDSATWQVLAAAHVLYSLSGGVFDPCLPHRPGSLRDLELLPDSSAMAHAPMAIDLGGIAKGYAIDQAILELQKAGCDSGMVNIGGDLRVFGDQSREIVIRTALTEPASVSLHNVALAVSERDAANRPVEHQGYYRRNGSDVFGPPCAAVLAQQAMMADALTKCVLLCRDDVLASMLAVLNATRLQLVVAP